MRQLKRNQGFTLLEILIVIVILGALAALAIPAYTSTTEKAKKQEAYQSLAAVREAQQRYMVAENQYATSFTQLDFNPTTTMVGQTAIFTYTMGRDATGTYTSRASRTGNTGAGGDYTVQMTQAGAFTSNF